MSSNCIGSSLRPRPVPGLVDWLLQMLHPSAVWGTISSALADVQVFSVVFTLVPAVHQSWLIILAAHPSAHSGARTLDPCVSSG